MEYAIGLRCYSLPNPPLRLSFGSKGYEDARGNTFGHRFNHATLCLTQISTTHPVARPFRHVNCMLNSFSVPSKNIEGGSDSKILRGVSRVSLVLSCILGLFNFSSKMNPKLNTAYARVESKNPKPFHQPDLMANPYARTNPKNPKVNTAVESIDPKSDPSQASFDAKKIHIEQMKKLDQLIKEYNKSINSEGELSSLRELVEFLIIQEKFQEAREHLDELIHRRYPELMQVSYEGKNNNLLQSYEEKEFYDKKAIAEISLYKAIVHTLLKDKEAAKWWEAFAKTLAGNE